MHEQIGSVEEEGGSSSRSLAINPRLIEAWRSDTKGFSKERLCHDEQRVKLLHPSICPSAERRNDCSTGGCEHDPWHFGAIVTELSWS